MFRPNFVFQGKDYFDQLFEKNNSDQESIGLDKVELLFYVKTQEGLKQIETGKKDEPIAINNLIITKTKNGKLSSTGFEFHELLIPENYINWSQDTVINYSMSYKGKSLEIIEGITQGSILINRKPRIEFKNNKIIEQNLIASYLQNDYMLKEKPGYLNIIQRILDVEILHDSQNRIDFDLNINFEYKKWKYVNYKMLGQNANNFIDFFMKGMIDIQNISTFNKIKTLNLDQFYKIGQIKDKIEYYTHQINIISELKTKYDWQANLVVEDKQGQKGIIVNPMNENGVNFTKKIAFNDLIIVISQEVENIDYSQNFQPIINLEFEVKRQYQIDYLRDDLFDIDFDDYKQGIKFINEHQKEVI
ncbi:hypothetical protein [Spiroplasma culicicola]|uniref:Uncharacterized protein n=1 Tax=Spiroplasma culicicola AES-1 TaxID=1276246 RepID=W6A8G1_9MOLU|nr:hypothetical protein [Spiroplasma culicicola]AHI53241.1 hypothetical protein SCULI_v1c09010 [Spiroplasma culicicola AES-1]